jgi:ribosomal subunit interface protein
MQIPLQITIRDFSHSPTLSSRIREKAEKLEELHAGIVSCRVTVEELGKHQRQGHHFRVRVDVRIPGKELVAHHEHEDQYVALREAFDSMRRQLEEAAHPVRREAKVRSPVGSA